jgi:hypothetical protein
MSEMWAIEILTLKEGSILNVRETYADRESTGIFYIYSKSTVYY